MGDDDAAQELLHRFWTALAGDPDALEHVRIKGHPGALQSVYDVTALAAATVASATLAVAEFGAARIGSPIPLVRSHRLGAAAAFRSEALLQPLGWQLPAIWDPIAGDYRAADGWIRLHTNYRYHREAALRALDLRDQPSMSREVVAAQVAQRPAAELESAVVAAGGCAAVMHTAKQWAKHAHGQFAVRQKAVELRQLPLAGQPLAVPDRPAPDRPLAGIRVLDLTRVICGPVATRTLAAWGAQVLRIDPPGFEEVPALLPETTTGKFCAALELTDEADRARFEALVARADVVIHGLRPGALEGLGYGDDALRAINSGVVLAAISAYGWDGPWAQRRGFDSLVQMSCGIAAAGAAESGKDKPKPLPAQALDHGTGYLVAAAICRALTGRLRGQGTAEVRASLAGTANVLMGTKFSPPDDEPDLTSRMAGRDTDWGPVNAVEQPGTIDDGGGWWDVPAGPLGRHPARFPDARATAGAGADQGSDPGRLIS